MLAQVAKDLLPGGRRDLGVQSEPVLTCWVIWARLLSQG